MLLLNLPALRCCPSPDVVVSVVAVVVVVVIVVQSPELSIGGTGGSTPI
jgi:hypothetical protein